MNNEENNDDLKEGEVHPMAKYALIFVKQAILERPFLIESIASSALSENRTAEICHGTLERIMNGRPVSDRYVLGLAWLIVKLTANK